MTPDFDASEAQQAAEEDWEADAGVDGRMTRGRFMDAIFECAHPCPTCCRPARQRRGGAPPLLATREEEPL